MQARRLVLGLSLLSAVRAALPLVAEFDDDDDCTGASVNLLQRPGGLKLEPVVEPQKPVAAAAAPAAANATAAEPVAALVAANATAAKPVAAVATANATSKADSSPEPDVWPDKWEPLVTPEAVFPQMNASVRANSTSFDFVGEILLTNYSNFAAAVSKQVQYELDMSAKELPVKNKVILVLLEIFGLGLCGVDRCYLGQTCVGVIKGLTLGGLTIWALMDYICVVVTCLSMVDYINALGMRVNFGHASSTAAFVVVIVGLLLKCCGGYFGVRRAVSKMTEPSKEVLVTQ